MPGSMVLRAGCLLVLLGAGLTGCTFVRMSSAAARVQVLSAAPNGCEPRGEVVVSITDNIGPWQRSDMRVRDELETLARNQAPGLGANRISPMTPPQDGRQRWAMWRCR